jgi:hypothetical protein
MDAPQSRNNKFGRGEVRTRIVNGASMAVDEQGKPIPEEERIAAVLK